MVGLHRDAKETQGPSFDAAESLNLGRVRLKWLRFLYESGGQVREGLLSACIMRCRCSRHHRYTSPNPSIPTRTITIHLGRAWPVAERNYACHDSRFSTSAICALFSGVFRSPVVFSSAVS